MKSLQLLVLIFLLASIANAQKANLTGSVYDANGSVITKAVVIAVNEKGERFGTLSNGEGVYVLELPYNPYSSGTADFKLAKYEIIVESNGFEKFVLKDFKFVNSTRGKMFLDFVLEVHTFKTPIVINSDDKNI